MKRFVILLSALLIFVMLLAMLIPSKVSVARTTDIAASDDSIYFKLADLNQWKVWFPIVKSKKATMQIISADSAVLVRDNGTKMFLTILSENPSEVVACLTARGSSNVEMQFKIYPHNAGTTRVDLVANTSFGCLPWQRAKGIFVEKITGPQYEEALENLKALFIH